MYRSSIKNIIITEYIKLPIKYDIFNKFQIFQSIRNRRYQNTLNWLLIESYNIESYWSIGVNLSDHTYWCVPLSENAFKASPHSKLIDDKFISGKFPNLIYTSCESFIVFCLQMPNLAFTTEFYSLQNAWIICQFQIKKSIAEVK